jgi:hypothetical protein
MGHCTSLTVTYTTEQKRKQIQTIKTGHSNEVDGGTPSHTVTYNIAGQKRKQIQAIKTGL